MRQPTGLSAAVPPLRLLRDQDGSRERVRQAEAAQLARRGLCMQQVPPLGRAPHSRFRVPASPTNAYSHERLTAADADPARSAGIGLGVILIAALVALLAAPGASPAHTTHNPISFSDPTGDAADAPDITRVTVSNTAARVIRFQVAIANAPVILPTTNFVGLFIDADGDELSGPLGGFEYSIQTAGTLGDMALFRWDGTTYVRTPAPSLVKTWAGGAMTFQIANTDLGNTTRIAFWAGTELLPADEYFDDTAPDGDGVYSYALATPHIVSASARFSSAVPRVGRRFSVTGVTLRLESDEQVAAASFRCRARLAGKAIRGSGRGGCTYPLTRTARGKRLVITIMATTGTQSRTLRSTFRVR